MPSQYFCGRDRDLFEIKRIFQRHHSENQRILAIHGLGGVGKTQICLSYVLATREDYRAVFWINSTSEQTINDSFRRTAQALVDWGAQIQSEALNFSRIALHLGMGQLVSQTTGEVIVGPKQSEILVKAILKWLERPENSNWLMVFDSADDLDGLNLQAYFPHASHGDILISSRRSESALLGVGLEVKCLEQAAGCELLLNQAGLDAEVHSTKCRMIANTLGQLPLALAQAASYMAATKTSPGRYLEQYHIQREVLLRHKPPTAVWQYKETVFTTWNLSFVSISKSNPSVARLLLFLGRMQPDDIWTDIFIFGLRKDGLRRPVWETFWKPCRGNFIQTVSKMRLATRKTLLRSSRTFRKIHWLEDITSGPVGIQGAFAILMSYSLLHPNASQDGVGIHPLVRLESPVAATIVRRLNPHVPNLLESIRVLEKACNDAFSIDLCHALEPIGVLLGMRYSTHRLADRLYVNKLLFGQTSKTLGLKNPITLVVLGRLALAHEDCQLFEDTVRLAELRYDISLKLLGPLHFDTRDAMDQLAKTLQMQGTNDQHAREVLELSLRRHKEATGDYRDGMITMLNLGSLLCDLGEFEQARIILEGGLQEARTLKRWHLLLDAYGVLALVASGQGRFAESLEYMRCAISLAEEHWGPHSEQALEWNGHSAIYAAEDLPLNSPDSIESAEHALKNWIHQCGEKRTRNTTKSKMQIALAGLYYRCGQNTGAMVTFKDVNRTLEGNPAVETTKERVQALNELGMAYWDYGFLKEAVGFYDEALRLDMDTTSRHNIELNRAVAVRDMGRLDDAERIFRQILAKTSPASPTNYASLDFTNLARILQARGQYEAALQMLERVVSDMGKGGSDMNSSLLLTLHQQAELVALMGKPNDAIDIWTDVFDEKSKLHGICTPATLKTAICLQRALRQTGRTEEAEAIADRIRPFLEYA